MKDLGITSYRVRLDLQDYDLQPPRVGIARWMSTAEAPRRSWPKLSQFTHQTTLPDSNKPWVCTKGVREYHDHFHHEEDPWDDYRNWMTLNDILTNLATIMTKPRDPSWGPVK